MTFYELVTLIFVAFSTLAAIGSFVIMLYDSLKRTRKRKKKRKK